jgi:hypothetical protein
VIHRDREEILFMSTVGTITKLATGVVGKAAHAVTHPRQTVTTVTGHARGLAATVTGGERSQSPADAPDQATSPQSTGSTGSVETDAGPTVVPSPPRNVEPAEPIEPAEPVEPSTTEPKAASRQAAHQGRGDEPTDDWHDELEDTDDEDLDPVTGQPYTPPAAEDEPLLDPSVAKAIRSESETLSRAAEPDKEQ